MDTPTSVDSYIATFPATSQAILQELRSFIQDLVPEATQKVSYCFGWRRTGLCGC